MNRPNVGSDIPYFCPRCQLKLAHRILAMVGGEPARVRCNTCQSERNYRARRLSAPEASVRRSPKRSNQIPELYQQKIRESLMKNPKAYTIQIEASEGDLIQHSKFGKGVVLKTIPPDRMEVLFPDELKILACKC